MDLLGYVESDDECDDDTGLVVPLPPDPKLMDALFGTCICYVRTTFEAANGSRFPGMICSRDGEGVDAEQPILFTDAGQVDFYLGHAGQNVPNLTEIADNYRKIGLTPDRLFPLTYAPDVSVPDGSPGGVLHGFYHGVTTPEGVRLVSTV